MAMSGTMTIFWPLSSPAWPDLVFHLAAQSLVRFSYQEPRLTYETNVMGTVNVLEAMRHTPSVRVAVNVTSDKCYENREPAAGYREEDPLGGRDPYSSSKGCSELVTAAYCRSFFAPGSYGTANRVALASVRAGNVIGGGDWGVDRLVPDCVRALSRQEEIVLRYPQAVRPWQHVLDPLGGYLLLGARLWQDGPRYAGPWNLGPDDHVTWTVEKVVQEIIRLWGGGSYRVDGHAQPHEARWLQLDCRKARTRLGWRPQYDVREALSLSIDWYRRFYEQAAPAELYRLTESQIATYQAVGGSPEMRRPAGDRNSLEKSHNERNFHCLPLLRPDRFAIDFIPGAHPPGQCLADRGPVGATGRNLSARLRLLPGLHPGRRLSRRCRRKSFSANISTFPPFPTPCWRTPGPSRQT